MGWKIGVKFCGHCNPIAEGPALVAELEHLTDASFVRWDEPGTDGLLILCGCRSGCASRPEFGGPVVTIAGDLLEGCRFSGERLAEMILERFRNALGRVDFDRKT